MNSPKSTDEKNGELPFPESDPHVWAPVRTPRGTRWRGVVPEGWLIEAAETIEKKSTFARINLRVEGLKFENYWISKTGKGATKIDWRRTWLNWALTAAQHAGHREREGQLSGDGYHENDDDYGIGYRP